MWKETGFCRRFMISRGSIALLAVMLLSLLSVGSLVAQMPKAERADDAAHVIKVQNADCSYCYGIQCYDFPFCSSCTPRCSKQRDESIDACLSACKRAGQPKVPPPEKTPSSCSKSECLSDCANMQCLDFCSVSRCQPPSRCAMYTRLLASCRKGCASCQNP